MSTRRGQTGYSPDVTDPAVAPLRFAVLGDPVEHSLSPTIHSAALSWLGIDGTYEAVRCDVGGLEDNIGRLRTGIMSGLNVTMPLKAAARQLAESLTREAANADSVNTLRLRDGGIEGHSSDAVALREIMKRLAPDPGAPVLVLGAGGAAMAALSVAGSHPLYLSSRTVSRASRLLERWEHAQVVPWTTVIEGALVINATPLGMHGESIPPGILESAVAFIDLPYGPAPTGSMCRSRVTSPARMARSACVAT